jgi:dipeptidyl aminopeptidase/acylaminoacyl peptidase
MRPYLLAAGLAVLIAGAARAAPPEQRSRVFEPRDLFALEWASDPQVRPDGSAVAYVRSAYDIMTDKPRRSIWLVNARGGDHRPLLAGEAAHSAPRWSPDGKRLAYVSTAEGARPQLFVRWMDSGLSARVASLPDAPGDIAWSPDGRYLAFTVFEPDAGPTLGAPLKKPEGAQWAEPLTIIDQMTYRADGAGYLKPGYTHAWVVAADGGAPRQLTFGAFDDGGPLSWTPDGDALVFSSNRNADWKREPAESELYSVDLDSGQLTRLTTRKGPDREGVVSPDGKWIAYTGFDDRLRGYENARLYVMKRDGSGARVLTAALDRSVQGPQWAADSNGIYVAYADHGTTRLARIGLDGSVRNVADGLAGGGLDRPYSGGEFSVARNGTIAATVGDPLNPPDLAIGGKGGLTRVTRLNDDLFAGKRLARVEPLPALSAHDQRPVDAWIVTPPGFDPAKKYPLILEIHGGPFASYGPVWSNDNQLYAAAGYVVVYANPRGSTSYGDEFANLIDRAYPGNDYDDLMSVVDAAIAKGYVDPDNLFVTGGSGGGVLTAWIIGKTHRFKAAAVQKPVINWSSFVLTADAPGFFHRYWFSKTPWEDPEAYWKRSPLSLMGNVQTPALVVVGDADYRTPVSESEQYYTALQIKGVPTALVKVPGASHGGLAARPSQSAAKTLAILAWFDKYRSGKGTAAPATTGE